MCLSPVIVNVLQGLDYGAHIFDPNSRALIYIVGAMFIDDSDLYFWVDSMQSAEELYSHIQKETIARGELLMATGKCLKPEKYFWCILG